MDCQLRHATPCQGETPVTNGPSLSGLSIESTLASETGQETTTDVFIYKHFTERKADSQGSKVPEETVKNTKHLDYKLLNFHQTLRHA